VFARSAKVLCKNCKPDTKIRGSVDITHALVNLKIVTAPEVQVNLSDVNDLDPNSPVATNPPPFTVKLVFVGADGKTPLPIDAVPKEDQPKINLSWVIDLGNVLTDVFNHPDRSEGPPKEHHHPIFGEWKPGKHFGVISFQDGADGGVNSDADGGAGAGAGEEPDVTDVRGKQPEGASSAINRKGTASDVAGGKKTKKGFNFFQFKKNSQ